MQTVTIEFKPEEGCRFTGSITVTNDGGTVLLEEAFAAVMVSTFETASGTIVTLVDLDLTVIDNMFIVSKSEEIVQAEEEQQEAPKGDGGLLDFTDLDIDFLEGQDFTAEVPKRIRVPELDINFLK